MKKLLQIEKNRNAERLIYLQLIRLKKILRKANKN